MESSPYLVVLRLIIQGVTKNYESKFEEGLNLVWGDMDSGKSSILNLIDYCLGGKNENLLYGEMKAKGRIAYLEVDLNGKIFTFERDILSANTPIRVYTGYFENRGAHFPLVLGASPSDDISPDGWVSDFILDNLGIARVSIKESRLREESSSDRLSFRDLMKLMYLKQTRVGSDALLNYQNPTLFNKNIEIQKFIFNIYDDKLAGLQSELSRESSEYSELEKNERFIKKFLSDVKIDVNQFNNTRNEAAQYEEKLNELDSGLKTLKEDFVLANDVGATISNAVKEMRYAFLELEKRLNENDLAYENFSKLSNTYKFDLDALKLSKISRSILSLKNLRNELVSCPLCQTQVDCSSPSIADDDIEHQLRSLKNKDAGTNSVLTKLREEKKELLQSKEVLSKNLSEASRSFDENNLASISPLLTSIHALEGARSEIKINLAEAERNVSIYNKYVDIGSKLEVKSLVIEKLRRAIKITKDGLLGLDAVIEDLTNLMNKHMQGCGLQNVHDVYVDKKFIAYFRNISYYHTSSGGVRTITSIALFVTRLQYLLQHACNLPTFLMIDTPGQNIGRYRSVDDNTEMSDPKLYENIFNQIVATIKSATTAGKKCQIIIVDNDLPDSLKEGQNFHLVKRFSKQGVKFDKGLINDM